jgi:hypothetical protein
MNTIKRTIAATEVVLIFPAVLFMTALFVRELQPLQYEPAHTAQQIVNWYAVRPRVGLWVLLMALPFAVLVTGSATLFHSWKDVELRQAARQTLAAIRAHLATLFVAAATLIAGGVLVIVAVHALSD